MEERKCSFCSTTKNYYSSSTKFFSYAVWLLLQFRVLKSARAASAFPRVFGRVGRVSFGKEEVETEKCSECLFNVVP